MTSFDDKPMRSPMENPLFRMARCDRHAAFGMAVVPDVNWMLIVSLGFSGASGVRFRREVCPYRRSSKGIVDLSAATSTRPRELSTRIISLRDGTDADSMPRPDSRSGAICLSSVMFSRGGLKARFVSAPMMRRVAERCDNAEMTWAELNAGFRGT